MDAVDREKIEQIIRDRKAAHAYYTERSSAYRAFGKMEAVAFAAGALGKAQKELVAIGISVHNNCESCMEWHIKQALDAGVTGEQILEAVGVGIEMGGGPATVAARFAMKVLEYYEK